MRHLGLSSISALLIIAFLGGCSVRPAYKPVSTSSKPVATIQGFVEKESWSVWKKYEIVEIDRHLVSNGFQHSTDKMILVDSSPHLFGIYATVNYGSGDACPCQAIFEIPAELKPGHAYRVTGEAVGLDIIVWIEEIGNNQRITDIYGTSNGSPAAGSGMRTTIDSTINVLTQ